MPTRYFERAAWGEYGPEQVRPKAIGADQARIADLEAKVRVLSEEVALLRSCLARYVPGGIVPRPPIQDIVAMLPRHTTKKYTTRTLSAIQMLVIHHTAVPATVGPEAIARYHVKDRDWPGIGYHFLIMADGTLYQTNRLETISYHAAKVNAESVGIAFAGNFMGATPTGAQLENGAKLLNYLIQTLGLTLDALKAHKDVVMTQCPGDQWDGGAVWRDKLLAQVSIAPCAGMSDCSGRPSATLETTKA